MPPSVLHGTIDIISSESASGKRQSFDSDETLHIYIKDLSQIPRRESALEDPNASGPILLGETTINLAHVGEFPAEFQCEYDPKKASNGQFDQLCENGSIVVAAEISADGREMTTFWLKSGPKKFEQNIKLTLTDIYQ